MPLDSTETHANAGVGIHDNGSEFLPCPEVEKYTDAKDTASSWCYLFIHHNKVKTVRKILERQRYPVFVHKSIVYRRDGNHRITKEEQPTVSGLVFVQGNCDDIQNVLKNIFFDLYLVKDCCTRKIAVIPDSIMRPFMRVSEVTPTRIRFMPHTIDYYSAGNPLIVITSGILSGLEGYRIRISRDKCLVTTIGGMTVAISGIHKDSFENLDEFVRIRREQLKLTGKPSGDMFTPIQRKIDGCFFTPQDQLDVMAMAESLRPWLARMQYDIAKNNFDEAVEIALFVLEETGSVFRNIYNDERVGGMKDIMSICRKTDNILMSVIDNADVSDDLKEIVETGRESLAIRFPFLPVCI